MVCKWVSLDEWYTVTASLHGMNVYCSRLPGCRQAPNIATWLCKFLSVGLYYCTYVSGVTKSTEMQNAGNVQWLSLVKGVQVEP